jgi:hypothetical protein
VPTLRLDTIRKVRLRVGGDPEADFLPPLADKKEQILKTMRRDWHPRQVQIEINGRQVVSLSFDNQIIRSGEALDLNYPPPAKANEEKVVLTPGMPAEGGQVLSP